MKNLVRFILSVVLLLTAVSLHAQNAVYPIQINATMLPPYTNCLGDYFNSGAKRAQVKVILRDISRYDKSLKFSLKVTVKRGNTVMLESTTPYPITLTNANVINDLSEHVAGLFSPNSVNHGGSYADNGYCLPEGSYEFVFQAFDFYRRNMPLSEPFSMFCYLNQAEPPILVYPEDGACGIGDAVTGVGLTQDGVQFQWMDPIATGPTNKTYELVLTEKNKTTDLVSGMFPNSSSSNNVLNLPLYNEKIHNNTFRFVPSSIFTEGNEYCWHVVASGGNLTGNKNAFKNGGKSVTNCFTYGKCPNKEEFFDNKKIKKTDDKLKVVLTEVNVNNEQKNAEAKWESKSGNFCKYYVYYYRKDLTDASAEKAEINDLFSLSTVLKNLEPGEEYSCYVIGVTNCDNKNEGEVLSPKSNEISFKLEKKEPEDEKCEANLDTRPCESLLETLNEKDYFYGTTSAEVITVTEITARGEDHSFSGKGIVSCTLLKNKVGLNVTFDNIQINSERYLCKGEVDAVHHDVDNLLINLSDYFGNKQNTKNTKQQEDLGTEVQDLKEAKNHKNETIIYNGELYAVDENGNPDKVGEVKKNGDLCDVPGSGLDNLDGVVVFDVGKGLNKDKTNPYDPYIDRSIDPFYSSDNLKKGYENQSSEYPIPWIAMVEGDTRWIEAHVAGKSKEAESTLKIDDVDFYCYAADGSAVKLIKEKTNGNSVKLKIYGGKPKTSLKIYARMNAEKNGGKCPDNVQTLGVAKIYSMSRQTKKILLAPVLNELTLNVDEMQKKVNEMFAPLGKQFEFTVGTAYTAQQDPSLTDLLKDGLNTDEGENHFTKETKEMKYLRRNYSEYATDISGYDACLFLIPKARKHGLEGYMPLNKSVGYIVVGENDNITLDAATIAHELCHGLFCLRHTFDYGVVEGFLPENLMDYPKPDANVSERYLTKYFQWNDAENVRLIHLSFFDDVEDGEKGNANIKDCAIKQFTSAVTSEIADRVINGIIGESEPITTQDILNSIQNIVAEGTKSTVNDCILDLKDQKVVKVLVETLFGGLVDYAKCMMFSGTNPENCACQFVGSGVGKGVIEGLICPMAGVNDKNKRRQVITTILAGFGMIAMSDSFEEAIEDALKILKENDGEESGDVCNKTSKDLMDNIVEKVSKKLCNYVAPTRKTNLYFNVKALSECSYDISYRLYSRDRYKFELNEFTFNGKKKKIDKTYKNTESYHLELRLEKNTPYLIFDNTDLWSRTKDRVKSMDNPFGSNAIWHEKTYHVLVDCDGKNTGIVRFVPILNDERDDDGIEEAKKLEKDLTREIDVCALCRLKVPEEKCKCELKDEDITRYGLSYNAKLDEDHGVVIDSACLELKRKYTCDKNNNCKITIEECNVSLTDAEKEKFNLPKNTMLEFDKNTNTYFVKFKTQCCSFKFEADVKCCKVQDVKILIPNFIVVDDGLSGGVSKRMYYYNNVLTDMSYMQGILVNCKGVYVDGKLTEWKDYFTVDLIKKYFLHICTYWMERSSPNKFNVCLDDFCQDKDGNDCLRDKDHDRILKLFSEWEIVLNGNWKWKTNYEGKALACYSSAINWPALQDSVIKDLKGLTAKCKTTTIDCVLAKLISSMAKHMHEDYTNSTGFIYNKDGIDYISTYIGDEDPMKDEHKADRRSLENSDGISLTFKFKNSLSQTIFKLYVLANKSHAHNFSSWDTFFRNKDYLGAFSYSTTHPYSMLRYLINFDCGCK